MPTILGANFGGESFGAGSETVEKQGRKNRGEN